MTVTTLSEGLADTQRLAVGLTIGLILGGLAVWTFLRAYGDKGYRQAPGTTRQTNPVDIYRCACAEVCDADD